MLSEEIVCVVMVALADYLSLRERILVLDGLAQRR